MPGLSPTASPAHGDLRARSVRGVFWVAADKWTNRVLNFLVLLVLAHVLQPAAFGTVSLANVFVAILYVVSGMGFDAYIVRAPSAGRLTTSTAWWIAVGAATLEYAALAAAAPWLAGVFHSPELAPILWVLGASLPLGAMASIPSALLRRELQMRPIAIRGVFSSLIAGVGAVILALSGAGAWALVFQLLATEVVSCVLLYAFTRWHPSFAFAPSEAKVMLRFGINVVGTQIVHQIRDRGDELLVGALLGTQALGYWTIATRILRTGVDLFTSVVTTVSLSSFSKVSDDRTRLAGAIRAAISASAFVVIPGLAALCILSPILIPFAFGPTWQSSVFPAQVLTLAGMIQAMQWIDSNIWFAIGKPGTEFLLTLGISAVHLSGVAVATHHGLAAVAIAILVRTALLSPARVIALRFRAKLPLTIYRNVWRTAVSTLTMVAAMVGMSLLVDGLPDVAYLVTEGLVAGAVYAGAAFMFNRALLLRLAGDLKFLRRSAPAASATQPQA